MSYEIRELVIKLDTNIKGDKPIDFNGNMLYFPEEEMQVGGNPYICVDIKYTKDLLSVIDETDIYKFFFDKPYLMSVLDEYKDKNETEIDDKDEHTISKHNIMFCIKTIFPTKYYTINNIHQSIQLKYPSGAVPSRSHYLFNPFNTKNAYLKIGATEYTVAKVTWLNDVLNHPEYKELLDVTSNVLGNYNRDIKQSAYIIRIVFLSYQRHAKGASLCALNPVNPPPRKARTSLLAGIQSPEATTCAGAKFRSNLSKLPKKAM